MLFLIGEFFLNLLSQYWQVKPIVGLMWLDVTCAFLFCEHLIGEMRNFVVFAFDYAIRFFVRLGS